MWNASTEADPKGSSGNGTNSSIYLFAWGSFVSLNYNLPTLIIVAGVLFIVIVATAFGNLLVVLALFKYRSLRTISNYLIGNLALSDFLLATTILPLSTFNECLGHWIFGQALCNAWLIMDVLYCTASIWNILVIAFDRFTATLYPIWYREKRSAKKAAIYIALVWLISCAICLPPVLGWNDLSQNYVNEEELGVYMCVLFRTPSYVLYSACGSFYIPFFMTFFFYLGIFIALRDRMRKTRRTALKAKTGTNPAHLQPSGKKPAKPKGKKTRRLEPEYSVEMVSIEDNKDTVVADENSSRSLFGSESDREKSVSDVDADVTAASFMTSDETTIAASLAHDEATTHSATTADDVAQRHHQIPSNGFVQLLSASHRPKDPAKNANGPPTVVSSGKNGDTGKHLKVGSRHCDGRTHSGDSVTPNAGRHETTSAHASAKGLMHGRPPVKVPTNTLVPGEGATRGTSTAIAGKPPMRATKQSRRYEQREMRATIRMAIIIAFFCGMWVGFFTVYVLNSWCEGCHISRELEAFFFWLGYSNSSINPILYTIFNDDFRKAFMQIVGCRIARRAKR